MMQRVSKLALFHYQVKRGTLLDYLTRETNVIQE